VEVVKGQEVENCKEKLIRPLMILILLKGVLFLVVP
jgi:hypothetical protein